MPEYQTLLVSQEDEGVLLIKLHRPQRKNALSATLVRELQDVFLEFDANDEHRVAVLTSSGDDMFSAGADVSEWPDELWRCMPNLGFKTDKPIVTAVSGWCIGGALTICMLSDVLVASESAKFLYPEGKLGFTGGMVASLAARIPHHAAMDMILLGRPLEAKRAYELGFVNEVTPVGGQVECALGMARNLARMSPMVLKTIKRFVNDHVLAKGPSEQMVQTMRALKHVAESDDFKEGMAAFKEKRPAVYKWKS
ncbi:enoyl-CoA hydratase/isomerase family protein [Candidimonas nitroreducens]|uniref:Enoyl-CoA hydratase n=1 Tax=Candidimonas nitroreducens TaxID=683354 RepID=A0A225M9T9_9BURK|nr:enoyl-CoA hydratase/isomerase family protein [Candidimonas nitroreducens]OWT56870.1 enoyl-CoA hydratase [Candidimonas nitroreducens]